jgi:hypothetical protein
MHTVVNALVETISSSISSVTVQQGIQCPLLSLASFILLVLIAHFLMSLEFSLYLGLDSSLDLYVLRSVFTSFVST